MKLLLRGHDDRYAVEQLQLALFPEEPMEPVTEPFSGDGAVSSLHTGAVWLTATAEITLHGKTAAPAAACARRRPTCLRAAVCCKIPIMRLPCACVSRPPGAACPASADEAHDARPAGG